MEVYPSVAGGSTGRFDMDDMLPMPLTMSCCATWFAQSRHGGLGHLWLPYIIPRFRTVVCLIG